MKRRRSSKSNPIRLQMVPLIDVVFQLLAFFIMTLKIVEPEGDFRIQMPKLPAQSTVSVSLEEDIKSVRIRLIADPNGHLANIFIDEEPLGPQPVLLREKVMTLFHAAIVNNHANEMEAILDCDPKLRYQYTIETLTAITGYFSDGHIIPLIEKVRFAKTGY